MATNVKNELTAFKIILGPCINITDDIHVKQCSCPVGKTLVQEYVKTTLEDYFAKKKPVPIRFFKEEHRAMMMEGLRDQRELLKSRVMKRNAKKNTTPTKLQSTMSRPADGTPRATASKLAYPVQPAHPAHPAHPAPSPLAHPHSHHASPSPKMQPPLFEYFTERYGILNGIICKIDNILGFSTKTMENDYRSIEKYNHGLSDAFKQTEVGKILFTDGNILKIELKNVQWSMINALDQIVESHKLVSHTCEQFVRNTQIRYKSEEVYSEDGSTIIVDNNEKSHLLELNSKIDNFIQQKTVLLKTLRNIIALTWNMIVLKNKLNVMFLEFCSNLISTQPKNRDRKTHIATIKKTKTVGNDELEKVEPCKLFKKLP